MSLQISDTALYCMRLCMHNGYEVRRLTYVGLREMVFRFIYLLLRVINFKMLFLNLGTF